MRQTTLEVRRELMAFAEIGIYRYTMDGTIEQMDEATLRILELQDQFPDPKQVVGKNISELFEYEIPPGTMRRALEQVEEVRAFEYSFRTLKGTRKCCLHDSKLVKAPDSKQDVVQVITRDISALKNAQAELEAANHELGQANAALQSLDEMKNNLLANVSHELRSPLVSVRGYADLILSGSSGPVTDRQQDQLQIIVNNVERLTAIVDDLLDAAQLDRGGPALNLADCDVNGLVQAALLSVTPKAEQGSISLDEELSEQPLRITADPRQLSQVLVNLLNNAIKFTPPGGQVVASTEVTHDGVSITVTDNGIGIPAEDQERVFDRFYQVDTSSTRRYTGLGLGLTLCRTIVQHHGGAIALQSTPKQGTTVRVHLPLKPSPG